MTVAPLILILLSLGCGVFIGVIGLAVAQGLQRQEAASQTSEGLDE